MGIHQKRFYTELKKWQCRLATFERLTGFCKISTGLSTFRLVFGKSVRGTQVDLSCIDHPFNKTLSLLFWCGFASDKVAVSCPDILLARDREGGSSRGNHLRFWLVLRHAWTESNGERRSQWLCSIICIPSIRLSFFPSPSNSYTTPSMLTTFFPSADTVVS
jgi:hypothetical protein